MSNKESGIDATACTRKGLLKDQALPQPGTVRHAEKRRTSTCRFADRVAQFCVDHYKKHVPLAFQEEQKQTCLAAIVAFVKGESCDSVENDGRLLMLGMGVGTKFLSTEVLEEEKDQASYGSRVRDCHAEVLARRAFRRQLNLCILEDLEESSRSKEQTNPSILNRIQKEGGDVSYQLRPHVTLHMYTSSAPCGNATLKKFGTMKRECFRGDLKADEWPCEAHEPILGHSIPLGQFALLVKKDSGVRKEESAPNQPESKREGLAAKRDDANNANGVRHAKAQTRRSHPALETTDWCPPGTSTVWSGQGSIHTCSDKICRWNYLGFQGSLLASILANPLYMSSLTVGRKLTECICRRAVCCRAAAGKSKSKKRKAAAADRKQEASNSNSDYKINHPAIMGTAVYMDETGVVDSVEDVRFLSRLSWAWWPSIACDEGSDSTNEEPKKIECIDASTGFVGDYHSQLASYGSDRNTKNEIQESRLSTSSLLRLHSRVASLLAGISNCDGKVAPHVTTMMTLKDFRKYKQQISPIYENQKDCLLSTYPLFRQWIRRETDRAAST